MLNSIKYLGDIYLPLVVEGEDFSEFKNPTQIYNYIKPYLMQITSEDESVNSDNFVALCYYISEKIFKMNKNKMKSHRISHPKKCLCYLKDAYKKML